MSKGSVFILSVSSDIGRALALKYLNDGYEVIGTFRNKQSIVDLIGKQGLRLISCDLDSKRSVGLMIDTYRKIYQSLHNSWDIFISCVGTMEPIDPFFSQDFDTWEESVEVNSTAQLRVLHGIYPYRRQCSVSSVVFFAGGGSNGPFTNYSAYAASKIFLTKMCELLDDECGDLNPFIIGPGFRRTKIHNETFNNPVSAGKNLDRTHFLFGSDYSDLSFNDIYRFINWAVTQGKKVTGGRNFSVLHDEWRNGGLQLVKQLVEDENKFKLRRFLGEEE